MMRICTCNAEVLVLFVEEPSTRISKAVFGHVCFVCNAPQSRSTVSRGEFDFVGGSGQLNVALAQMQVFLVW